jgi:hypothetical protein
MDLSQVKKEEKNALNSLDFSVYTLENERDGKCNFIYVGMIHINKIKV